MTKTELRILYLLRKNGGQAKKMVLSQGMARVPSLERERALANVEQLELVSSAKTPSAKGKGGQPGVVYWLTDAGDNAVDDLIDRGKLKDPELEPRANRGITNE